MPRAKDAVTHEDILGALAALYDAYDGGEGAKRQADALRSLKEKMGGTMRWDKLGNLSESQQRGLRQALARERARGLLERAGRL